MWYNSNWCTINQQWNKCILWNQNLIIKGNTYFIIVWRTGKTLDKTRTVLLRNLLSQGCHQAMTKSAELCVLSKILSLKKKRKYLTSNKIFFLIRGISADRRKSGSPAKYFFFLLITYFFLHTWQFFLPALQIILHIVRKWPTKCY